MSNKIYDLRGMSYRNSFSLPIDTDRLSGIVTINDIMANGFVPYINWDIAIDPRDSNKIYLLYSTIASKDEIRYEQTFLVHCSVNGKEQFFQKEISNLPPLNEVLNVGLDERKERLFYIPKNDRCIHFTGY